MQGVQIVNPKRAAANESKDPPKLSSFFECHLCHTDNLDLPFEILMCNHMFHEDCLKEYFNKQVTSTDKLEIKCPKEGCKRFAKEQLLLKSLNIASAQKYQRQMLKQILTKRGVLKPCTQSGCKRQSTPKNEGNYNECSCDILKCGYCNKLRHEGKDCIQALDKNFYSYAKEHQIKYCTKCKTIVTDPEGCKSIVCPRCEYEWCFTCGRDYNHYHEEICCRKWNPPRPVHTKTCFMKLSEFFLGLIIFILLIPIKTFFWSYWYMDIKKKIESDQYTDDQKLLFFLAAFIVNIIYLGFIGALVWLFVAFPPNRVLLGCCIGFLLSTAWILEIVFYIYRVVALFDHTKPTEMNKQSNKANPEQELKQSNNIVKNNQEGYAAFDDCEKSTQNASNVQNPNIKSEISISPFLKQTNINIFSENHGNDNETNGQIVIDIQSLSERQTMES